MNQPTFLLSFGTTTSQLGAGCLAQDGTYYRDRHQLYEGAVILFRRPDSWKRGNDRIWQARFKLDGMAGYKRVSLKTPKYEDAYAKARDLYLHFQEMVREGSSLRQRTFAQAWNEWFNQMDAEDAWADSRKKWHRNYFNRYFNPYFGTKRLDEITMDFAHGYWSWRKTYWIDGPGANSAVNQLKYNRRRRGLGNTSTANAKRTPAHKTLLMEQSALNQIFSWCYSKRLMRYAIRLKVPSSQRNQRNEGRRASFTDHEWLVLTRNLRSWADGTGKYAKNKLNDYHRHHRKQLRYFVLFIGSTGIRPGTETRWMKWEDIEPPQTIMEKDEATGLLVPKEVLYIHIRKTSKKGKSRTVISLSGTGGWMKEWRAISHYPGDQQLIWYGGSKSGGAQKPTTDLNKTFQHFLKTVAYRGRPDGLLNDADGNRRSLYSIRHHFASSRVRSGVSYEDLRRTMDTGIPQLVKHYDDTTRVKRAAQITKTNYRRKSPDLDVLAKMLTPEQVAELTERVAKRS